MTNPVIFMTYKVRSKAWNKLCSIEDKFISTYEISIPITKQEPRGSSNGLEEYFNLFGDIYSYLEPFRAI